MKIIENFSEEFNKAIDHFKADIGTLKTGRANPSILDSVLVEAYGVKSPINQVATVSVPDSRSILIQPWDKNVIRDLEKAIIDANLGFSPVNEGDKLRINLPVMTEEVRKDIVKKLHQKTEEARVSLRNIRDKVRDEIIKAEKNKEFGEDEKFTLMEELDKKIAFLNDQIKAIGADKEKEIMTI